MSKALQRFVDNFTKGFGLGESMQYRRERMEVMRMNAEIQRQRYAQLAAQHKERMDLDRAKGAAYIEQAQANAAWLRRRQSGGGGGGAPQGISPQALDFMTATGGDASSIPQPQAAPTFNVEAGASGVIEPPAASSGPDMSGDNVGATTGLEYQAQGGRVRNGKVQRYAYGGKAAKEAMGMFSGLARAARPYFPHTYPGGQPGGTPPFNPNANAGTSGPGSGYGQIAAPPDQALNSSYIPGFQGGGDVRPAPRPGHEFLGPSIFPNDVSGYPMWPTPPEPAPPDRSAEYLNWYERTFGPQRRRAQGTLPGDRPITESEMVPTRTLRWSSPDTSDSGVFQPYGGQMQGDRTRAGSTEPVPAFPQQQSWQGEEARADETVRRRGTSAVTEPDVPPQYPRRAPAAINTGWLPLDDQRRTAAYDPTKESPRARMVSAPMAPAPNGGGQQGSGAGTAAPSGAPARPPVTEPMGGYGYDPQGANVYGAGLSSNNAARDFALTGAATYGARATGNDKQALANGTGAPDAKTVAQVFQTIDPENKMPMSQKMDAALRATHDFYMAQGNKTMADRSAFEIYQFGNAMAKQHGAKAIQALQGGNQQEAINQLLSGYNWLPDGYTAEMARGSIVLKGRDGSINATIPLQPGTIDNLAFGMASGHLGMDALAHRVSAPQSQAQPQAPAISTSAPMQNPMMAPSARERLPSAYIPGPAGQAPPAPTRPAAQPTAAPTGPAAPQAAPQQRTVAPSPLAPKPPPSDQGVKTTVPTRISGGAGAIAGTTSVQGSAGATVPPQGDQPRPAGAPLASTTQTSARPSKPADADTYWKDDPYKPLPQTVRVTAPEKGEPETRYNADVAKVEDEFAKKQAAIVEQAKRSGLNLKNKGDMLVFNKRLATLQQEKNTRLAELRGERSAARTGREAAERHDIQVETKPRSGAKTPAEEGTINRAFDTRRQEIETRATAGSDDKVADAQAVANVQNSPLRYRKTAQDHKVLSNIARGIWRNNDGLTHEDAYDLALSATSITPKGKGVGNGLEGVDKALTFAPIGSGQRRDNVVLQFGSRQIQVDKNTYDAIVAEHKHNARDHIETTTKAEAEKKRRAALTTRGKAQEGLGTTEVPAFAP